jgi:hypothetical protein
MESKRERSLGQLHAGNASELLKKHWAITIVSAPALIFFGFTEYCVLTPDGPISLAKDVLYPLLLTMGYLGFWTFVDRKLCGMQTQNRARRQLLLLAIWISVMAAMTGIGLWLLFEDVAKHLRHRIG